MLEDLDSATDIRKHTDRLLRKAGAYGVFPTPVDEIINAAGLTEADEDLFDASILSDLPGFMQRQIRKLKTKVQAALDRQDKIIYLNQTNGNSGSRNFRKLHEVSHDIFPWQDELGYADDNLTLSAAAHRLFEQEANQGAAELLFQTDQFEIMARDYPISVASIIDLGQTFGSSIHAAFRRFPEFHRIPMVGIVLEPQPTVDPFGFFKRCEIIPSIAWRKKFGEIRNLQSRLEIKQYPFLKYALEAQGRPNQIIEGDVFFQNLRKREKKFKLEVLFNSYSILILMWHSRQRKSLRARRVLK